VVLKKSVSGCSITVSDNGSGFTRAVLESLDDPEKTTELQSHGLGLKIVQQIAKAHGGEARFSNTIKSGCEAVIFLPIIS